jgi:hypothetical protein
MYFFRGDINMAEKIDSNSGKESDLQSSCERNQVQLIKDARKLLDFAVGSGFKTADDHPISKEIISVITEACDKGDRMPPPDWTRFELAYYDLTVAMSPITVETLRDTEGTSRTAKGSNERKDPVWQRIGDVILGYSPAQRFTRGLWVAAIAFMLFVMYSGIKLQLMAQAKDGADDRLYRDWRTFLELLSPWAYGGLGSCVFLLRSAHTYIYRRTFDIRRKPEYLNRILLGMIAGGAIILFADQFTNEDGAVLQLSSTALGFLAGYSTDFLFNTIERIITAIFPKVQIESSKQSAKLKSKDNSKRPADRDE